MKSIIVGIDLGTTNSCCFVANGDGFTSLLQIDGQDLLPSRVRGDVVGASLSRADKDVAFSFKRDMEHSDGDCVINSSKVLGKIVSEIKKLYGEVQVKAVITVPAEFNSRGRRNTMKAAEMAGIEVLELINEPTAASIAADLKDGVHAVFDLGGGTFDVSIVNVNGSNITVLGSGGSTMLGGDDIDLKALELAYADKGENVPANRKERRILVEKVKKFKETLNPYDVLEIALLGGDTLTVTARHVIDATAEILSLAINYTRETMKSLHVKNLESLVLVGGSTKSKVIREALKEEKGLKVNHNIEPDLSVAKGAAMYAGAKVGYNNIEIADVLNQSIGIEVVGNRMLALIHKGTTLPAKSSVSVACANKEQDGASIVILQGNVLPADECTKLYSRKFDLKGEEVTVFNLVVTASGVLSFNFRDNKGNLIQDEINVLNEEAATSSTGNSRFAKIKKQWLALAPVGSELHQRLQEVTTVEELLELKSEIQAIVNTNTEVYK